MLGGIKQVLIISTPLDIKNYKNLFGDGSQFGISISNKVQPSPDGLAQAFILGENFIGQDNVCLILGDNIFYGASLPKRLKEAVRVVCSENFGVVFGYNVSNPKRYGVVQFNSKGNVVSIEEKPQKKSKK